jgi:hypothetical protein
MHLSPQLWREHVEEVDVHVEELKRYVERVAFVLLGIHPMLSFDQLNLKKKYHFPKAHDRVKAKEKRKRNLSSIRSIVRLLMPVCRQSRAQEHIAKAKAVGHV